MDALDRLHDAGLLDDADHEVLRAAYRFCETARNRLFLVESRATDALPQNVDELRWLARSLETTPAQLREEYRRRTRRARQVVERVFYGREDV